jgi:hypothetical protein
LSRISQQYYMQVSAWMIRMEADLTATPLRMTPTAEMIKKEITNRAGMFLAVSEEGRGREERDGEEVERRGEREVGEGEREGRVKFFFWYLDFFLLFPLHPSLLPSPPPLPSLPLPPLPSLPPLPPPLPLPPSSLPSPLSLLPSLPSYRACFSLTQSATSSARSLAFTNTSTSP